MEEHHDTVLVRVIEATNLAAMDSSGWSDPFCRLRTNFSKQQFKTGVKPQTLTPYWDEIFPFYVQEPFGNVFIRLWDKDRWISDDFLGEVVLDLSALSDGKIHDLWLPLLREPKKKKELKAQLHIQAEYRAHNILTADLSKGKAKEINQDKASTVPANDSKPSTAYNNGTTQPKAVSSNTAAENAAPASNSSSKPNPSASSSTSPPPAASSSSTPPKSTSSQASTPQVSNEQAPSDPSKSKGSPAAEQVNPKSTPQQPAPPQQPAATAQQTSPQASAPQPVPAANTNTKSSAPQTVVAEPATSKPSSSQPEQTNPQQSTTTPQQSTPQRVNNEQTTPKTTSPQPAPSQQPSTNPAEVAKLEDVYEMGEQLGKGAFSTVRRGKHKVTSALVAIKIINKKSVKPKEITLLRREIGILKKLRHVNIIQMYDLFEDDKDIYIVLELVTGGELFDQIVSGGAYSEEDAAKLVRQVLQGVAYMHKQGIVHRDLKPENLLCVERTRIKIADFGMSKDLEMGSLVTSVGSPSYVAPEILTGAQYPSPLRARIRKVFFDTGNLWLLCGLMPFYGNNQKEKFQKIMKADYSFPSPEWDTISAEAKGFIAALLVTNASQRLTAEMALRHEWLQLVDKSGLSSRSLANVSKNLSMMRQPKQKK